MWIRGGEAGQWGGAGGEMVTVRFTEGKARSSTD